MAATLKDPAALVELFRCPVTGQSLRFEDGALVSESGERWPVVAGIPRFVSSDHYVGSFSFEWNTHSTTQLDSQTGSRSSEEMLRAKTGLDADQVRGKLVLDAGVGAGRFADVLARWGARVVGVDLSFAVEAAQRNFDDSPDVIVAQADIARLPFAPATFDFIVSIGVLHHTPDTRAHFMKLVPLLKPGGEICVWVYPNQGEYQQRAAWIPFTRRIPNRWFYSFCLCLVPWAHRHPTSLPVLILRWLFPFSNQGLGLDNDVLDTFDGFSPRYHGIHNPDEVVEWFRTAGLVDVRTFPWDTAVRGRRPSL